MLEDGQPTGQRSESQDAGMTPNQRRAAHRAQMREEDWTHPRDPREDVDTTERLACEDPYCRFCKDQDGEVRDGFNL